MQLVFLEEGHIQRVTDSGETVTLKEQRRSGWEEIPVLTRAAAGRDFL